MFLFVCSRNTVKLHNFSMEKNSSLNNKILKKLAINIKQKRSLANISQEQLADKVGVERSYITAIEIGAKSPSVYCLYLIARALNTSIKELVDINLD